MKTRTWIAGMGAGMMGMALNAVMGQAPVPAAPGATALATQLPPVVAQLPTAGGQAQGRNNFGGTGRQRGRNRGTGREQNAGGGEGGGVATTTGTGFAAFQLVQMRNMFDPNRYPNSMATERRVTTQRQEAPPKATDYVALTGVMVTGDNELAFFSGSRPDYDRVLQLNGEVAGAKVTKITSTNIEVDRDGKKIVVGLGQTVPFDANTPPGVPPTGFGSSSSGGGIGGFGFGGGGGPGGGEAASSSAAPTISSGLSDVMRRMMERRQQQLK